jgi:hypothetical protein
VWNTYSAEFLIKQKSVVLNILYILFTYSCGHTLLFIFNKNNNVTFLFNSSTQEEGTSGRFIFSTSKGGHTDKVLIIYKNRITILEVILDFTLDK